MIERFINSTFGIECKVERTTIGGLALYMTAGREFFMVSMEGISFLLVKISSNDRFGVLALERQLSKYRGTMKCEVAFYFEHLTNLQRKALIERQIPFIAGSDQIYLTFLGIVLRNNLREKFDVSVDKMMPATQSLFLYLLYKNQKYVLKKQAADDLGLTRTSITRASEQLKAMGLITEEACGKEVRMRTISTGYQLYVSARPYLVTPVLRKLYVDRANIGDGVLIAGESALSRVSLLGEPRYEVYAISKKNELVKRIEEVDIRWQENVSIVQLEVWKYDPALFARNGMVDPISLALSLSDNDDERVQSELEKFMEEYEW